MLIGQKIICLDSVDSTNNYIANLIKRGEIDNGTVILAEDQYAGRGQRNTEWSVKPGENLTFSVYLDSVNLSVENQFMITEFTSLILFETLKKLGVKSKIKWPNDIFVNDKKIAGVLIENQLLGKGIKSSIIGIGLNINQQNFDSFDATSTFLELHSFRNPKEVLMIFIDLFNQNSSRLSVSNQINLKNDYLKNLYLFDELKTYEDADGFFEGRIISVLDSGHLVILSDEKERTFALKEVTFVK